MDPLEGSGQMVSQATAAIVGVGLNDNRQVGADNTIVPGLYEVNGVLAVAGAGFLVD